MRLLLWGVASALALGQAVVGVVFIVGGGTGLGFQMLVQAAICTAVAMFAWDTR